jgi:hypothetical protein
LGAWGVGNFENDDAYDWLDELLEHDEAGEFIDDTLSLALEQIETEVRAVARGLAAAEVVAALRGKPAASLPDDLREWLDGQPPSDHESASLAEKFVRSVVTQSPLAGLWLDDETRDAWIRVVRDLQTRLEAPQQAHGSD